MSSGAHASIHPMTDLSEDLYGKTLWNSLVHRYRRLDHRSIADLSPNVRPSSGKAYRLRTQGYQGHILHDEGGPRAPDLPGDASEQVVLHRCVLPGTLADEALHPVVPQAHALGDSVETLAASETEQPRR